MTPVTEMRRSPPLIRAALLGIVALLVAAITIAPAALAAPLGTLARDYTGGAFGPAVVRSPTQRGQQSKLWFHDGAWWAVMVDPSSVVRIFELMADHTWRPTSAVVNDNSGDTGDVLADGDVTYVLARSKAQRLQLVRLDYNRAARAYLPTGPPSIVTDRGASEAGTIAKDTTGRLWMSFATSQEVLVSASDDDGRTWSSPFVLAVTGPGFRRDAAALVSFDRSVGVMWSEEAGGVFRFAVHRDGAAPTEWTRETALAGPGRSQAHLSVKVIDRDPGAVVVAVVQTVDGDQGLPPETPMLVVLARAPDGTWSAHNASTVEDALSSPILQVDPSDESVYLVADSAGSMYIKRASLSDLTFPPAKGIPLMLSNNRRLNDATGSKGGVNADTGLVTLASGGRDRRYHHVELPLGPPPADPADSTAPGPPGLLAAEQTGSGSVVLRWTAATEDSRWWPAADGVPVAHYVVHRDGREIGTTARTSFADNPPEGVMYTYAVRSVDHSGQIGGPAIVLADAPSPARTGWVVGIALLGVTLVGAAVLRAMTAAWPRQRLITGEPTDPGATMSGHSNTQASPEATSYRDRHLDTAHASAYDTSFADTRVAKGAMWRIEQDILGRVLSSLEPAPRKALDFACGTGRVLGWLTAEVADCTGVDISAAMLAEAAAAAPDARLVRGDVTAQPTLLGEELFDLVTMFRFLLNAEPVLRRDVLAWVAPRVRPGGVLVANVHRSHWSLTGLLARVSRVVRRRSTPHTLSIAEAVRLVESHGFIVEEEHGYGYLPYGPHGTWRLLFPTLALRVERRIAGTGRAVRLASHVVLVARRNAG